VKQKILSNSCTARTQLTDLQGCEGTVVVDGHAASTVSETEVRTKQRHEDPVQNKTQQSGDNCHRRGRAKDARGERGRATASAVSE